MRGVAGYAELRLEMRARYPIDYAAMARRVGVPTVACADEIIHPGADGFTRIIVWRRVINRRAKLIEDVVGVDADVVSSTSDDPRGELVAGQSLNFMWGRDGIRAAFITLRFAVFD